MSVSRRTSSTSRTSGSRRTSPPGGLTKVYVLDTSILLADPAAIRGFAEHEVVLPLTVITELESKRHHPELGWAARQALRTMESMRVEFGHLDAPIPVNDEGGTMRVELNHRNLDALPDGMRGESSDHRILAVAANLAAEGRDVALVSKDLPLRLKACVAGLEAQEYQREVVRDTGWSGMVTMSVAAEVIDRLYADKVIDLDDARELPCHTGLVLTAGSQSVLGRVHPDKRVHQVAGERTLFDVHGRSAEQRLAIDLLADESIGIVSMGGPAGTGKTVLALAAGLEAVLERRTHRRLVVFRPLYAVGQQDLGYLPGTEAEKMAPWAAAVFDALDSFVGPEIIEEVLHRGLLEVLPLTHLRGRTLPGSWVVIDEAQNVERTALLTALSRLGAGSRAALCWDVAQRDNLHVGRHDGVVSVVQGLAGHPLFAHVGLLRSERSPVAALVAGLLEHHDFDA
ncbi:MAG: PhoH family protein [Actinomycetes bacterium]